MRIEFHYDISLYPEGDAGVLYQNFLEASSAIKQKLDEVHPELAERLSQATCKTVNGGCGPKYIYFDVRLRFPGASGFAQWEFKEENLLPARTQIVEAFLKRNKKGLIASDFTDTRLGETITWALEKGAENIMLQNKEVENLAGIEL